LLRENKYLKKIIFGGNAIDEKRKMKYQNDFKMENVELII